ncbi:MAG: TIGR01777 family oxidoreductase, partial [Thermoleophilia bacterium]|nr:TIGR01777 family oxidoreductase [Thermoleophilia bacterium]
MAGRKIVISGASGLIGRPLTAALTQRGDDVIALTRGETGEGRLHWDPDAGELDIAAIGDASAVVHLAGESLIGFWTAGKKRAIIESRRNATTLLASAFAALDDKPEVFVSSSAIGYYGSRGDELLDEDSGNGEGFLAEVVRVWEDCAAPARDAGIRTVALRIGLVLGKGGGVLGAMKPLFKLGAGGKLAGGDQWWSWVTLDDVVRAFIFAIDHPDVEGAYNLSAPRPVTNAEFTKTFAHVLHRPAILHAPRFALRLTMREMADETMLASQRIDSGKLRAAGFKFADTDLEAALRG